MGQRVGRGGEALPGGLRRPLRTASARRWQLLAHGDSVYGVADLVGYVWQYTDEFRDEHTRTVLLKGSSVYTPMLSGNFPALPQSENWYFPKALELDRHGRMMLMDDSYERAATLGFRCVADHEDGLPGPHHYRDLEAESSVQEIFA
mmetsp:Transcript_99566/g.264629  ORF Transcript_99566/g.264629 Transcript_99566/m.264629 type:complete len:147 (-) Transcript_99566:55-495(-)